MIHLGFGKKWRNWVLALWCTTSSSVLLFLLAMEPLHLLFKKAHESNLLKRLRPNCETCKISLYADDVAIFIHPNEQEIKVTDHILQMFAEASGLITNMDKTIFYPIRCDQIDLQYLNQGNRALPTFPYT
jgi:hypothetical protein